MSTDEKLPTRAGGTGASAAQQAAVHEEHDADVLSTVTAMSEAICAPSTMCIGHGARSGPACEICIGIIAQPKPDTASTVRIGNANNIRKTIRRFMQMD